MADKTITTKMIGAIIFLISIFLWLSAKEASIGCNKTAIILERAKAIPICELEQPLSNKKTEA